MDELRREELEAVIGEILTTAAEGLHDTGITGFSGDQLADTLLSIKDCAESALEHRLLSEAARLTAAAPALLAVAQFLLSIEKDLRQYLCQCDEAYCAYCSWLNDAQSATNKALGAV